jgi:hypothetical protein
MEDLVSNRTKTWREQFELILLWLALPFLPIIWPVVVVRTLRDHRELARLTAAGKLVKAVETSECECEWRLKFADDSNSKLLMDDIRGGTWYEFSDHHGGFAQSSWHTVLAVDLAASATLIMVGPESDGQSADPLAAPCKALAAAGRIRGPIRRSADVFPGFLDFAMAGFWLVALVVLAIVVNDK